MNNQSTPENEQLVHLIAEAHDALPHAAPRRLAEIEQHLRNHRSLSCQEASESGGRRPWWLLGLMLVAGSAMAWWGATWWLSQGDHQPSAMGVTPAMEQLQHPGVDGRIQREQDKATPRRQHRDKAAAQPPEQETPIIFRQ